ncbi:Holliday junction resolvase RuvX [Corynebacterium poyangense]|uniref:Putative pre-16S rRNA nuclease n=1 Tax=Corynebacterium poyangense TaxID=2684405 RepID=A0A7H0SP33_9CORY|nr:Holliday junction resolvase RuvX [Corynebacterium poyangense]MBZ8177876.1 Holliday junction resolvase RuvX [Corynebacterium poyangense]QNQ90308.1 Holliday junction resolvase RuvX [Corynebacterium poyangense]
MKETPDTPGADDPGSGRRIGIDVGTVRIGVAASDRDARLAMPVETVPRDTRLDDNVDGTDIDRLVEIIAEYDAVEVVVGLPRDLNGHGSISVQHAKDIAKRIARRLQEVHRPLPVRLADERLSTAIATQALRSSGVNTRRGRKVIDQAAAVEILQSWLDARKRLEGESHD